MLKGIQWGFKAALCFLGKTKKHKAIILELQKHRWKDKSAWKPCTFSCGSCYCTFLLQYFLLYPRFVFMKYSNVLPSWSSIVILISSELAIHGKFICPPMSIFRNAPGIIRRPNPEELWLKGDYVTINSVIRIGIPLISSWIRYGETRPGGSSGIPSF